MVECATNVMAIIECHPRAPTFARCETAANARRRVPIAKMSVRVAQKNAGWIIFAAAFISRAILVLTTGGTSETFYDEPGQVAISLSQSGHFANPYIEPTGPTAHVAPLMPVLLSVFIRAFGDVDRAWLASRLLQCLVMAFFAGLLPVLAERFGLSRRAGIVAGLTAVLPAFLWVETNGKFETAYTLLATTVLVVFTAHRLTHNQLFGTTRSWALIGAAWAAAALIAPTVLPIFLALVASGLLSRSEHRLRARQALATLASAALVVAPYSINRSLALHGPVLVRSNFGLELFLSNNDNATPRFQDNMAPGHAILLYHPLAQRHEAVRVRMLGEVRYNRMLRRRAIAWIATHPAGFARLTSWRLKEFWFPTSNSILKTAFLWSVTVVAVAWLVAQARGAGRDSARLARLWLVALVAYSLVHYVIQADVRYRYPIQGLLVLATSAAVVDVVEKQRRRRRKVLARAASDEPKVTAPAAPVGRPEPALP